ncbi:MAG: hypothetical protein M1814_002465 [Vezdaea aestivalis]|nr:MAG: hypothetical protein M1814_002465 [Vezdaea aestivalis]
MASKLLQCDPEKTTVIRHVTPNIVTCSLPFSRYGQLKIGARGTIIKTPSGSLVVFSPTPLTRQTRETVETLGGEVKYLIAPDAEHYLFLKEWLAAFPGASIIGPASLAPKLQKSNVPMATQVTYENQSQLNLDAEFSATFDLAFVGAVACEVVLLYRPEKTLLVADLLFNLPAKEQYSKAGSKEESGVWTKAFNRMRGLTGQPAVWQRRILGAIAASDKTSFDGGIQTVAGWEFERIIVCHGDVIEEGGKEIWKSIFEGHLSTDG